MTPRWKLTEHALARGAYALRCPPAGAERRLYERMDRATFRATDRHGRELYRSSPRDGGLRWVVDPKRGAVLWVGQQAPPADHWEPDDDAAEPQHGGVRIEVTLDRAAMRLLEELSGGKGGQSYGQVIGRALRVLYDQERR